MGRFCLSSIPDSSTRPLPKNRWVADGYFDVWLPTVAPQAMLVSQILKLDPEKSSEREKLFDRYERQLLSDATGRQTVKLIARMAAELKHLLSRFSFEVVVRTGQSRPIPVVIAMPVIVVMVIPVAIIPISIIAIIPVIAPIVAIAGASGHHQSRCQKPRTDPEFHITLPGV